MCLPGFTSRDDIGSVNTGVFAGVSSSIWIQPDYIPAGLAGLEKARHWKRSSPDLLSMLEILTDDRIGFEAPLLNEWQLDFFFFFILYLHNLHFQDEFRGMTEEGLGLRSSASQIL